MHQGQKPNLIDNWADTSLQFILPKKLHAQAVVI